MEYVRGAKVKEKVYNLLLEIPDGFVTTYGIIAETLENKRLARVVGNILHQNEDGDKYPCYKVVNSSGNLACHYAFGGIDGQKKRLENDGIVVQNNKVSKDYFYYFNHE